MKQVAELEQRIAKLTELMTALERENKLLREENAGLRNGIFGRKSERLLPGQLGLFVNGAEPPSATEVPASVPPGEPPKTARPKGHGRAAFPADMPRDTTVLDVPEEQRVCSCCGKAMQLIGDEIIERGHMIPARMVVRRYVKRKYGCPDGHEVKTAEAPAAVIERCKYEPSVYGFLTESKYGDHIPLTRLAGILARQGVHLPKQTMWDMLVKVDELVAQPVLRQMQAELLECPVLHADETPVTVRLEDQRGTRTGYIWDWRAPARGDEPERILTQFTLSRGRDGPKSFLNDWGGTLVVDGYSGYEEVVQRNGITRAGCWSHARRKFKEAWDTGSKDAAAVLRAIGRLFWLERSIERRAAKRGLGIEAVRARVRQARGRGLVDTIYARADQLAGRASTLPKSKLGKAITYLFRQRTALEIFLGDPRIQIHNNDSERDLRHIAVGRKNWLVFGSPRGGEVASRLYSLALSCRRAGVSLGAYIEDMLTAISTTPETRIASLTPWAWAARQQR
jgi:transposase